MDPAGAVEKGAGRVSGPNHVIGCGLAAPAREKKRVDTLAVVEHELAHS
jgi:hypothetical protein